MKPILLSAFRWGLIGGFAIIILQTVLLLITPMAVSGFWVMLVYLPLLFCMIFGGITIRKENSGSISYMHSLLAVFIIAVTGSLLLNIYVYEIWMKLIDPEFNARIFSIAEKQLYEQQDKYGLTDAQVEERIKMMHKLNFELLAFGISAVCSILLSLVVAAFVSRPDKTPDLTEVKIEG